MQKNSCGNICICGGGIEAMSSVELDYDFRAMQLDDLPSVIENERQSYSHPWSEGIFADCVKSGHECWLFLNRDSVAGHGILSIVADESHLLNVCVKPSLRGRGYGRILVEYMLDRARLQLVSCVFLEVRPSNLIAYKLYESMGFNEVGLRKDYYPAKSGREDAIVFAKELLYD